MTDYTVGDTFSIKFTTRQFSDGVPTTAAGLVVAAYPDNSVTELTAGITTTFAGGFDGRPGLVNVQVVATIGNGYASGSTYYLVVTAGTVGGVSIVGEVVGEFTLGRSAAATALATAQTDLDTITGTDGVTLATAQALYAPAKATDIVTSGAITTSAGAVSNVTLVATTTTNADMRGTDNAALAATLASKIPSNLVFSKTGEVDANMKSINDAEVIGDGNGIPWDGV